LLFSLLNEFSITSDFEILAVDLRLYADFGLKGGHGGLK
jgi:hypothetical protein